LRVPQPCPQHGRLRNFGDRHRWVSCRADRPFRGHGRDDGVGCGRAGRGGIDRRGGFCRRSRKQGSLGNQRLVRGPGRMSTTFKHAARWPEATSSLARGRAPAERRVRGAPPAQSGASGHPWHGRGRPRGRSGSRAHPENSRWLGSGPYDIVACSCYSSYDYLKVMALGALVRALAQSMARGARLPPERVPRRFHSIGPLRLPGHR
jgi:hypothetical protein